MSASDPPPPSPDNASLPPEVQQAIRKQVARGLRHWMVILAVPMTLLLSSVFFVLILLIQQRNKLADEFMALKTEAVRWGQRLEIHNPNWGTVIDGVDPSRLPGLDPRDPRRGVVLQQFVPLGNDAQVWELRPREGARAPRDTPMPASAKAYCAQGYNFLHRQRQVSNAIAAFRACLEFYPDASDAHHGLAQALRESGDTTGALASHDRAIELDPGRYDLYWERGLTRLRLNDYDGAIVDFEACLKHNGSFGNAHLGLGMAYRGKGDFTEALKHHDDAIGMNPGSAWFFRERAATHQKKGDTQRAEEDLAQARELERRPQ